MQDNFQRCLSIILKEEGGNDDDPRDPGGRTSRGITQHEWDIYRQTHSDRPKDVWQAPSADVQAIYQKQYWDPYCDGMPDGLDLVFFNTSVNSGRTQAVRELQRALQVRVDGMLGMETKNAIANCSDLAGLIHNCCEQRRAFYRALKTFPVFGKGWLARTDRIEKSAITMVQAQPIDHAAPNTLPFNPETTISAKAEPDQAATPIVSQETGVAVTTGSSVGGGLVSQLQDATSALQPFSGTLKVVTYILIAVALVSFGFTVYAIWKNHNVKEAIA